MEMANILKLVGAVVALLTFIKGVYALVHANAIHRYEKFHEMSIRFDKNKDIQNVCAFLHSTGDELKMPTKQQKEVFICFLEEVLFMVYGKIMKRHIAMYSFGYYGKLAIENDKFWKGLNKSEPYYVHFREFCRLAREYHPSRKTRKRALSY